MVELIVPACGQCYCIWRFTQIRTPTGTIKITAKGSSWQLQLLNIWSSGRPKFNPKGRGSLPRVQKCKQQVQPFQNTGLEVNHWWQQGWVAEVSLTARCCLFCSWFPLGWTALQCGLGASSQYGSCGTTRIQLNKATQCGSHTDPHADTTSSMKTSALSFLGLQVDKHLALLPNVTTHAKSCCTALNEWNIKLLLCWLSCLGNQSSKEQAINASLSFH